MKKTSKKKIENLDLCGAAALEMNRNPNFGNLSSGIWILGFRVRCNVETVNSLQRGNR